MDSTKAPQNLINSVFTPLLISGTGIVITAVAILLYHFIIVRFCLNTERHVRRVIFDGSLVHDEKRHNQGLDKKILNTIPTLHYSSQKDTGQPFGVDQSECAICLGEFEEKVVVRLLPNCRHTFHVQCVDEWLSSHTNCPVCRSPVFPIVIPKVPLPAEDHDDHDDREIRVLDHEERCRFDDHLPLDLPSHVEQVKPRRVVLGLKRSFSMDQSHVLVDILQRKNDHDDHKVSFPSSSKECLRQSRSYTDRFDWMSPASMMSFSQLRMGRDNSISNMGNGSDSTDPC